MTDISIVIVNYNVKDHLDACLASIYKSNNNKYGIEIFIVDNNSIDGSSSFLKGKYPNANYIENEKNLGFSKANNIALKRVSGKYVLILNPDTILEEGTFEKLISFCENNKEVGAISSKLIMANGKLDLACKRSFPSLGVALPRITGLSKLFPKSRLFGKYNLTYLDENETHEVDAVCGAFMFIPKYVLDKAGLFDEDYFMYGEDLDLCFRIKKNGYKIYYYPEVKTVHLKGESTKKSGLAFVNNFYGAMNIFVSKNLGGSVILTLILKLGVFYFSFFSYLKRLFRVLKFPVLDIALLFISFVISIKSRFDIFPNRSYLFIIAIYITIWILIFSMFRVYAKKYVIPLASTFNAIIAGFFINSSITYFFKEFAYSREVILLSTILGIAFLLSYRGIISFYRYMISKNIIMKKINLLIVGDKELNQDVEERFLAKYNVIYFNRISDKKDISTLSEIINLKNINEVVFSGDYFTNHEILKVMWDFSGKNVIFKIVPTGNDLILSKLHSNINDLSLVEIEYNIKNKMNIFLKRLFDVIVSILMIFTVYPFIVLYYKAKKGNISKHTSKLLMLPGVFTGKYSFVGIPVWYETKGREYLGKKGLTGIIQLNHFEGIGDEEMMNYNIFYAKNQNLKMDIEILLKTVFFTIRKT
ncbi:MAG: glycosyltransferase [Ignavibacteriae bacterium]|nr:glycosyltransferase [Ignavibacteriota bacterium]